jgi:uncharacterized protein YcbK (DUF882 family)
MQEDSSYYHWNKGDIYFLDKKQSFKTSEFACHCNYPECKEQRLNKKLFAKLLELRQEVNEPLIITSAFRCSKYQERLRAEGVNTVVAKKSTHELGDAIDVRPIRMKVKDFLGFCEKKFYAIGIASNFLHLDMRGQDNKQVRRWNY